MTTALRFESPISVESVEDSRAVEALLKAAYMRLSLLPKGSAEHAALDSAIERVEDRLEGR